jgi:predicted nucleic acid-binding Zn ribbon protein
MPKRKARSITATEERGKLVRLGEILPQMFARYGLHRRNDNDQLVEAWSAAIAKVNPAYVKVTQVVGFQRSTLEIAVPHSAFVQELSFVQQDLLTEIQKAVPERKFKKIKFVVA